MRTKVTKQELKECVLNAVNRVLKENEWDGEDYNDNEVFGAKQQRRDKRFDAKKRKQPNHAKMAPIKKDKYRSY